MGAAPILTIAVPTYNMERWLEKNLATYRDPALFDRLEVLCLNNASEDRSRALIEDCERACPRIFTLVDRPTRGYGGSVNEALARARGRYFRIVDADDWVDTGELVRLVEALETCSADVVLTDYQVVDMGTGAMTPVRAGEQGVEYGRVYRDFAAPARTLPSIHGTTYRTQLLRTCGFYMQDDMFFVDEEYVVLPYLRAESMVYYPFDVYRYQVDNPEQSTSPRNRARYQEHRERVLKRLIAEYEKAEGTQPENPALPYCFERIRRGVGDHFTTLYMYVEPRREGRRLAKAWRTYVEQTAPAFWRTARKKAGILSCLNRLHVSLETYGRLKARLLP